MTSKMGAEGEALFRNMFCMKARGGMDCIWRVKKRITVFQECLELCLEQGCKNSGTLWTFDGGRRHGVKEEKTFKQMNVFLQRR